MIIDPRWIDVDLDQPPEDQGLGWEPQTGDEMMAATPEIEPFSSVFPQHMVPRSQWKERAEATMANYRAIAAPIVSQGREGSCVGFACKNALENTIIRRFGRRNWRQLSGVSLYKRIGRSASSGAYIPNGIQETRDKGVLPVNSTENARQYIHTHPDTGFSRALPTGWTQTASLFRASAVATCRGMDEIASALLGGFTGVVGRQRHAINYQYLTFDSRGNFFVCYGNSWSVSWGQEGFGFDSERTASSLTMYVILDVVTRPDIVIPEL
jgi:hypothetical protein